MAVRRPKRSEIDRPTGMQALAAAISHPMRVRIIGATNSPRRRCSPNVFAEEAAADIGVVSYHFRELAALGFLEVVEEKPRRGSIEHVYGPTLRAAAWEHEWRLLPPAFKQILASLTLRMGVEAIGAALDDGRFEARDDSVIAQDTIRVDSRGADESLAVMLEALDRLVKISEDAEARLAETDEEGTLVSYLMVGFEGTLRPV